MNFIQKIIEFLKGLFGGKKKKTPQKPKSTTTSKPKPTPTPQPKKEVPITKPEVKKLPEMVITEETMKQKLYLGHFDESSISVEKIKPLLSLYHKRIPNTMKEKNTKLRHGDIFKWVDLKPLKGTAVKTLQSFLVNIGILPESYNIDGFFGYGTQAGVRLFQEYERTHGQNANSIPNGIVDENTWKSMKGWQTNGKKADKWTRGRPSDEFNKWMSMLKNGKNHYLKESNIIIDTINKKVDQLNSSGNGSVDTLKIQDWNFDSKDTHLIGIRRNEDNQQERRINDDLFILLINGMVFKFWGSTDPSAHMAGRADEAFLVEGQHKFRFGWHKVSNDNKLYQGLNPYNRGVLVFRDKNNDNRLTEADVQKGIDNQPNTTINIHGTGIGTDGRETWSAGCQVMAAKSYIDNSGKEWDCSSFLLGSYKKGTQTEDKIAQTKGAYNMFTDLVVCYRPKAKLEDDYLFYTLGREENLTIEEVISQGGDQIVSDSLRVFNIHQG